MILARCTFVVLALILPSKLLAEQPARELASVTSAEPMGGAGAAEDEHIFEYRSHLPAWFDPTVKYRVDAIGGHQDRVVSVLDTMGKFDLGNGTSVVLYGLGGTGKRPSETFPTSSLEAPSTYKLYEAYVSQNVGEKFSVLAGLRDLNADFYVTPSSSGLLNGVFGMSNSIGQTGVNGPSIYPNTALALTAKYGASEGMYLQGGAFNAQAGDPDHPYGTQVHFKDDQGYLSIAEAGYVKGQNKYALGAWSYSRDFNDGVYGLIDHEILKGLSGFLRQAFQNPEKNGLSSCTELGFTYLGVSLGVAYASDHGQDLYRSELNYRFSVYKGIWLTPDFQYEKDNGIGTLRAEFNF